MLSIIYNLCRVSLTRRVEPVNRNLKNYARLASSAATIAKSRASEKIPPTRKKTIIRCKNTSLNFYAGDTYDKFKPIPLVSKGWHHQKSIGDYFVIYPEGNPETEEEEDKGITESKLTSFHESELNRQLVVNLIENNIEKPSEIQRTAIPTILSGRNTIVAAETGCGKTLAYMLPILEQIIRWKTMSQRMPNEPLGLILSPSRDLAQQLGIVAKKITRDTDVNIRIIIGGSTKKQMINPYVNDVDLLIGTLGAVSKLTTTGIFTVSSIRHVVLDEADTLLDDSFNDKLRYLLGKIKFSFVGPEIDNELPRSSQLTLVSATMPRCLPQSLDKIINTGSLVRVTSEKLHKILPQVPQKFLRLHLSSRPGAILKLVKENASKRRQTLVFCNRIKTCEWVHHFLTEMGINSTFTHGDLPADVRADTFAAFQRGHKDVLVTTDACSRGLDTVQVRHVVNFDFPLHTADYIHRCGRTGRLGSHERCQVTNFVTSPREIEILQKIEMSVRYSLPLPNVNANITKVIKDQIENEIIRTKELMDADKKTELHKI